MNIRKIMDHINIIEKTMPVQGWKIEGIDVWPFVRNSLYFDMFNYSAFEAPAIVQKRSTAVRAIRFLWQRLSFEFSQIGLFFNNRHSALYKFEKNDAVFFADASYVKQNGKYYQRFCDPIIDDLKTKGISTTTFTFLQNTSLKLCTPAHFITGSIVRRGLIAVIKHRLGMAKPLSVSMDGLDRYNDYIEKLGEGAKPLSIRNLSSEISAFLAIATYCGKILKAVSPRRVFIVSYYDDYNMAIVYACRQMGIPVTDIQHGAINDFNGPYGRWINVPSTGYNTLPNFFACWDNAAAECINDWGYNDQVKSHHAFVSGNKFLKMFIARKNDESEIFGQFFRAIQTERSPTRNILISIQTKYGLTDLFRQMLKSSPDNFFWWIRLHPMMTADEIKGVHDHLGAIGRHNYEIEQSTASLLYSVLPHMDVHVTLNSSVVQEAAEFGVPSIIFDDTGYEYYEREIEQGHAYAAATSGEGLTLIGKLSRSEPSIDAAPSDEFYRKIGLI